MDFKKAREDKGLTVQQVSQLAGYAIGTISDLENKGLGSDRLREKLKGIYGIGGSSSLREEGTSYQVDLEVWRRRAKSAEAELAHIKNVLRGLVNPALLGVSSERPSGEEVLAAEEGERIDREHRKR
jgi:hypothetical protein